MHAADGGNGPGHRHADVEIESLWRHLQVMRKPRPGRTDALRLYSRHRLADARSHDVLDPRAWRLNVNGGDKLCGDLDDLRRFDHVTP